MADEVTTLQRRVDFLESSLKSINIKFNLLVNFVNNKLDLASKAQDEQNKLFSTFFKDFVEISSSVPEPHSGEEIQETETVKLNGHPLANVTANYSEEGVQEEEQGQGSVYFDESQEGSQSELDSINVKNEYETEGDVIFQVVDHNSPPPQNRVQEEAILGMSSTNSQIIPQPVANLPYKSLNRPNLRMKRAPPSPPKSSKGLTQGNFGIIPKKKNVANAPRITRIPKQKKSKVRKFPSNPASSVWQYFVCTKGGEFGKCTLCGKNIRPRADNMNSHLVNTHDINIPKISRKYDV